MKRILICYMFFSTIQFTGCILNRSVTSEPKVLKYSEVKDVFCNSNSLFVLYNSGDVYRVTLKKNRNVQEYKHVNIPVMKNAIYIAASTSVTCFLDKSRYLFCESTTGITKINNKPVIDMEVDQEGDYLYYIDSARSLQFVWFNKNFEKNYYIEKEINMIKGEEFIKVGGRCAVKKNFDLFCWRHEKAERAKIYKNNEIITDIWGTGWFSCYRTQYNKIFCMVTSPLEMGSSHGIPNQMPEKFSDRTPLVPHKKYYTNIFWEFIIDKSDNMHYRGQFENMYLEYTFKESDGVYNIYKNSEKVLRMCRNMYLDNPIAAVTKSNKIICIGSMCGYGIYINQGKCTSIYSDKYHGQCS